MAYSNFFTLKLIGNTTTTVLVCSKKCSTDLKTGKFCDNCGAVLSEITIPINQHQIIDDLREFSYECHYLLDEDGTSYSDGSGNNIEEDIRKFSVKYPNVIFQLDGEYESGLEENPSRDFFKNGKHQTTKTIITFEKFDESKLK